MRNPSSSFWAGRRVVLTGHTGFKGSWLALWLSRLGAAVHGLSLDPATRPSLWRELGPLDGVHDHRGNVCDATTVDRVFERARPEVVLHLAAQPLVRYSYRDPVSTFASNVMGTVHVLDAARRCDSVQSVVIVTTDKVYRNAEGREAFSEDAPLGGHDPYSASKAAAELVAASYRDAFLRERGVGLATARAGNVIGGGDWSADRLIPDAMTAWRAGRSLVVRRPRAVRPWQHVLEPLSGYLLLAERLHENALLGGAWNFGPRAVDAASVAEVLDSAMAIGGRGAWHCPDPHEGPHEAGWLALNAGRAESMLGVAPRWGLEEGIRRTVRWYGAFDRGVPARRLCLDDLAAFERDARAAAAVRPIDETVVA